MHRDRFGSKNGFYFYELLLRGLQIRRNGEKCGIRSRRNCKPIIEGGNKGFGGNFFGATSNIGPVDGEGKGSNCVCELIARERLDSAKR